MPTLCVIVGDDNNIDILISKNMFFFIHVFQFVKPQRHTPIPSFCHTITKKLFI